jgi:type VI secretion system protein ImpA
MSMLEGDDCGPNLEFDPDFDGLERAAQGKPDQQFGDLVVPAEDPDWKDVLARAESLCERTQDLRILAHLAVAQLNLSGLSAYAATVAHIRQVLTDNWDQVHPQLDPDDDNDPTLRANGLLRLGEPRRVIRTLRNLPLAISPRAGRISWREIGIATGSIEPDAGTEKTTEAAVIAAFRETDQAKLQALREAIQGAARDVAGIGKVFDDKAGYGTGPSLDDLAKLLNELRRYVDKYAVAEAAPAIEEAAAEPAAGEPGTVAPVRAATALTATSLSSINTRAEAVHLLDLVTEYYTRNEPSSPLPLLIDRARRLADKNFMDILRDLAPDGLNQAQTIAGQREY